MWLSFAKKQFYENRGGCDQHDGDNDHFQVLFKIKAKLLFGEGVQVMPDKQHRNNPGNTTHNIIKTEFLFVHIHNAGNNGCKCANER